jgi:hypothetical protein
MRCPYCNGAFRVRARVVVDGDAIRYGLIECRCFTFPIIDGVLLLSLAKGYGGSEEALQPYVPIQVAAIGHLEAGDVPGLLRWIRAHAPLVADFIEPVDTGTYLECAAELHDRAEASRRQFLAEAHEFEVIGSPPEQPAGRGLLRRPRPHAERTAPESLIDQLRNFYVARFVGPRQTSLALMLATLRRPRRLLSLCCGHGVVENIVRNWGLDVVSVDGQLLNLLITRRYSSGAGSFICHDVQFPLPFPAGEFDGVVSSTCLPEIPAQRSFATEAIRVTNDDGWTLFDSVWNTEIGVERVDAGRHYRFCQNFVEPLDEYVTFFDECGGDDHEAALDVSGVPADYLAGERWSFGDTRHQSLADRSEHILNFLVVRRGSRPFHLADLAWLDAERLSVCPAYAVQAGDGSLALDLRSGFDDLLPHFAPDSFAYDSTSTIAPSALDHDRLVQHLVRGHLALLPANFGGGYAPLPTAPASAPS